MKHLLCFFLLLSVLNAYAQRQTVTHKDDNKTIYTNYYANGKVKSIETNGWFAACGMYVDTSFYYDSTGELVKTIVYDPTMPKEGTGCHDTITFITITKYKKHKIISIKRYKEPYEGERFEIK